MHRVATLAALSSVLILSACVKPTYSRTMTIPLSYVPSGAGRIQAGPHSIQYWVGEKFNEDENDTIYQANATLMVSGPKLQSGERFEIGTRYGTGTSYSSSLNYERSSVMLSWKRSAGDVLPLNATQMCFLRRIIPFHDEITLGSVDFKSYGAIIRNAQPKSALGCQVSIVESKDYKSDVVYVNTSQMLSESNAKKVDSVYIDMFSVGPETKLEMSNCAPTSPGKYSFTLARRFETKNETFRNLKVWISGKMLVEEYPFEVKYSLSERRIAGYPQTTPKN